MKLRLAYPVLCTSLIVGCAGSPMRIALMSPEELQSVNEEQLCSTYYRHNSNEKLVNEITRRKLITESEWTSINNKQITAGMKRCSVFAALGNPRMIMRSPIESQKQIETLVFPVGGGSLRHAITVYLVDGVVMNVDRK